MAEKLTERAIRGFKVPPGKAEAWLADTEVKGLYVRVTPKGVRSFWFKWAVPRSVERPKVPIGTWGAITLEAAREIAQGHAATVARGGDPRAERREREEAHAAKREAERLTLKTLIEEWERRGLKDRRDSYKGDAVPRLRRAFADALDKPAAHLTRKDVVAAVQGLHDAGKATTGRRIITYGRAMFGWAIKADLVAENPFLSLPFSTRERHRDRFLKDHEIGAVYAAAALRPYPSGPFVQLLLLTAQRENEVAGMRWSEITPDLSEWTIPADRAKNGNAHVIYLSKPARAILTKIQERPRSKTTDGKLSDFVFTTGDSAFTGFSRTKRGIDRDSGVSEPGWVFHDFRRTFSTRIVDPEFGVSESDADRVLNHVRQGVQRRYQLNERKAQRAEALRLWGEHVARCAEAQAPAVAARVAENRAETARKLSEAGKRSGATRGMKAALKPAPELRTATGSAPEQPTPTKPHDRRPVNAPAARRGRAPAARSSARLTG